MKRTLLAMTTLIACSSMAFSQKTMYDCTTIDVERLACLPSDIHNEKAAAFISIDTGFIYVGAGKAELQSFIPTEDSLMDNGLIMYSDTDNEGTTNNMLLHYTETNTFVIYAGYLDCDDWKASTKATYKACLVNDRTYDE